MGISLFTPLPERPPRLVLPAVVGIDALLSESGINGFGCSIVELVRTFTRSLIIESVSAIGVLENGCCEFGFGIPCERNVIAIVTDSYDFSPTAWHESNLFSRE